MNDLPASLRAAADDEVESGNERCSRACARAHRQKTRVKAKILFMSYDNFGKKFGNNDAECVASKMLVGQCEKEVSRAASGLRKRRWLSATFVYERVKIETNLPFIN